MISFVRGTAAAHTENALIVDTGSIGYEVFMTAGSLERIRTGDEVKIYTYLHVREDVMQLYGFLSRDDMKVFTLLLSVNGVGPRAALGILSGITADELRFAVLSDDVKTLSKAPGIGKKTAQKMILELKDKLDLQEAFDTKTMHVQEASQTETGDLVDAKKEAVQALTALGYSGSEALRAVKQVDVTSHMDVEEILKLALKKMNF